MGAFEDHSEGTTLESITFIAPGVPVQDPDTLQMTYPEGTTIVTDGNFIDLSPTEIAKRQQIQDDSKHKLKIKDTAENRTITAVFTATVNSVVYQITGRPRKPQLFGSWITVYLKGV